VRQVLQEYKFGESWPRRNFEGLDFLEPLWPRVAVARGDVGRVVLNSALPYSLLTAAFAAESTDQSTLAEITRWNWVGIDQAQNNNPLLFGLLALAGASVFLPSPEDGPGYSWALRLDRATVFALGVGTASLQTAILKPIFDRTRPNGTCCTSRPSGHAMASASPWTTVKLRSSMTRRGPNETVRWRTSSAIDGSARARDAARLLTGWRTAGSASLA
jgi:hypothetical protein